MELKQTPLQIQIGKELKQFRLNRNLTLQEVEQITGTLKATISRTEQGKYNLTLQKLEAYAGAYNLTPIITFKKLKHAP